MGLKLLNVSCVANYETVVEGKRLFSSIFETMRDVQLSETLLFRDFEHNIDLIISLSQLQHFFFLHSIRLLDILRLEES